MPASPAVPGSQPRDAEGRGAKLKRLVARQILTEATRTVHRWRNHAIPEGLCFRSVSKVWADSDYAGALVDWAAPPGASASCYPAAGLSYEPSRGSPGAEALSA